MEQNQDQSGSKLSWDEEKRELARRVFKQAEIFMEHDNKIIKNAADITEVLATYLKQNPSEIVRMSRENSSSPSGLDEKGIAGAGFGDKLWEFIERVVIADKEFFLGLISKLINI